MKFITPFLLVMLSTQQVVAQETKQQLRTVKVPTTTVAAKRINKPLKIQPPSDNREYRLTGVTLQAVSLKACVQFQKGIGINAVKANILNTIVDNQEDLSIKDAHRVTSIIAKNAQSECGQLGSND